MQSSVSIFWLPNSTETCHIVKLIRGLHSALAAAKSHALLCIQLSNALHALFVCCIVHTDCKFMQPPHVHLLLACPASAVWWAMLHFLVHRPGPLGPCKTPVSHSLFYRRLLQRLVSFQDHIHHPDAVQAHTDCTTIAACPACMLCRYAQLGPYTKPDAEPCMKNGIDAYSGAYARCT